MTLPEEGKGKESALDKLTRIDNLLVETNRLLSLLARTPTLPAGQAVTKSFTRLEFPLSVNIPDSSQPKEFRIHEEDVIGALRSIIIRGQGTVEANTHLQPLLRIDKKDVLPANIFNTLILTDWTDRAEQVYFHSDGVANTYSVTLSPKAPIPIYESLWVGVKLTAVNGGGALQAFTLFLIDRYVIQ